jgi:hypothetical protein
MSISEKVPDFNFLDQSVLKKKNILFTEKEITLKDLGKSRFKLFLTKGTYLTKQDHGAIVAGLVSKSGQLHDIIHQFEAVVQNTQLDSSNPEVNKLENKDVKIIHQTASSAKVFANILKSYLPKEFDIKKEGEDSIKGEEVAERAENAAIRLNANLFLEKIGMGNIVKCGLYELRASSGYEKELSGPSKDFMNFIKDKNREIKIENDLHEAFAAFKLEIRDGKIPMANLKNYSINQPLKDYMDVKNGKGGVPIELTREEPLFAFQEIQKRMEIKSELQNKEKPLTPDRLETFITDPSSNFLIKSVYNRHQDAASFQFLTAAIKYEQTNEPEEKKDARRNLTGMIMEKIHSGESGEIFFTSHSNVTPDKIGPETLRLKNIFLESGIKNYNDEIKKALLTGNLSQGVSNNPLLK